MDVEKWLIVGLGNPGKNYANTRHNVGFMVADLIADRHKCKYVEHLEEPASLISTYMCVSTRVMVVKPLTYMNLSGLVVRKLAQSEGITPKRCVVIADEINFPTGRIHLRKGGSDGGHNGLTSIIQELNSADFWRLRCGIGRDFGPGGLVDYVLSPFPESEHDLVSHAIAKAADAVDLIVRQGAEKTMQEVNRAIRDA